MRSSWLVLAVGLVGCATADDSQSGPDAGKVDNPIDAAAIDARLPIDGATTMPIDAAIDAPSGVNPDTCPQAQDLSAGAAMANGITVTGNTVGYADDIQTTAACTGGFVPDGPDAIYIVNVPAGKTLTAVATPTPTPTSWDISLELVTPCQLVPTCLDGSDVLAGPETASFTATAATTVYVAVDGYNPGIAGAYSLNVRVQ